MTTSVKTIFDGVARSLVMSSIVSIAIYFLSFIDKIEMEGFLGILELNTDTRPIVNKYCEEKMKSTLKRESKRM